MNLHNSPFWKLTAYSRVFCKNVSALAVEIVDSFSAVCKLNKGKKKEKKPTKRKITNKPTTLVANLTAIYDFLESPCLSVLKHWVFCKSMFFQMCLLGKVQRVHLHFPHYSICFKKITCVLKLKTNKHYKQQWGTVFFLGHRFELQEY